jgi:hypothetical protein
VELPYSILAILIAATMVTGTAEISTMCPIVALYAIRLEVALLVNSAGERGASSG